MHRTPGRDGSLLDRIQRAKAEFEDLLGEHSLEEQLAVQADASHRSPRSAAKSFVQHVRASSPERYEITERFQPPEPEVWSQPLEPYNELPPAPAWTNESVTAKMTDDEKVRIIVAQQTEIEKLRQQVAQASEVVNVRYQELASAKLEGDAANERLEQQLQAKDAEIATLHERLKASEEKLRKERITMRHVLRRLRSIEAREPLTCRPPITRHDVADRSFIDANEQSAIRFDAFPELTTDADPMSTLYFTQELS